MTLSKYTSIFQEDLNNLGKVLRSYIEMHLSLSPEKCEFLKKAGVVLGHSISQARIQVDPNKTTIIKRAPAPQKKKDVRIFLGLVGYYRRFIEIHVSLSPKKCEFLKKAGVVL